MKEHVEAILAKCVNYALNILRNHGMNMNGLQQVFHAKIISRLTYASPAWCGMANQEEHRRIDAFLNRSKKFGYYPADGKNFQDLCDMADERLFTTIQKQPLHVLYKLLLEKKQSKYEMRKRKHDYTLPEKDDRNFINRIMYKDI